MSIRKCINFHLPSRWRTAPSTLQPSTSCRWKNILFIVIVDQNFFIVIVDQNFFIAIVDQNFLLLLLLKTFLFLLLIKTFLLLLLIKTFLRQGFTLSLAQELKGTGVTVQEVQMLIKTNLPAKINHNILLAGNI